VQRILLLYHIFMFLSTLYTIFTKKRPIIRAGKQARSLQGGELYSSDPQRGEAACFDIALLSP
jgi:hypothetical protein